MDPRAHDPFADRDEPTRTFLKPDPRSRGAAPAGAAQPAPPAPPPMRTLDQTGIDAGHAAQAAEHVVPDTGLNPLVALANRLLLLVPQLRATQHVADPAALRASLAQGIRDFQAQAAAQGIAPERVMAARYVLCTMIDEAASDTPWGGSGTWGRHSLLAMFHNETEGGEKVFQLMARLAEKPEANRDLLELIYAALVLGFEGRYRVVDNGRAQLEAVRDKLATILKKLRGDVSPALADHWQGQPVVRRRAWSWLPIAGAAAATAIVLVGAYLAFSISLGNRSDPVFAEIQSIRLPPPMVAPPQPAPRPRLAQFLQSDIKAGLVAVRDEIDRSVVTIRGDGLFAPSSATLEPARTVLMVRIADALAQVNGNVLVTGHTDSQPISRSARFPSNWHLSEARAKTVRDLLVERRVAPERIRAEGRADAEPVVGNDTPGNRALNRRVDVTLFVGRTGDPSSSAAAQAAPPVDPPASGAPR